MRFILGLAILAGPGAAFPDALVQQANPLDCLGSKAGVQRVRDGLQASATYLKATKNNFGTGRKRAIDAATAAIVELDRLQGADRLPPSAATLKAEYLGEHWHPRMMRAWEALRAVDRELGNPACSQARELDPLRARVADALAGVDDAFRANPPGSHH